MEFIQIAFHSNISVVSVLVYLVGKTSRAFSPYSGSVLWVWPSILIIAIYEDSKIAERHSSTCGAFLMGVPPEVRNPLSFHSIPNL